MEEINSLDQALFNEKSLYLLNIRELRALGRKFGVPSPTSKSKQELVDYILKVVYGEIEIPVRKNNYGRKPNSNSFDMGLFLDKIKTNTDFSDELKSYSFVEDFGLSKVSSPTSEYITGENFETRIYFEENGKHFLRTKAFIGSADDIEITTEFAKKFGLINLDVVEVIICENLIKPVSINGIKLEDNFTDIIVDNSVLRSGQSRDFYLCTKEEIRSEIEKLIEISDSRNISIVLFTENDYKGKNLQSIKYFEDEDKSQIYKKLMLFAGMCEKATHQGDDLIVVLEDGNCIKNILDKFDEDVQSRTTRYLRETFNKITKLGNIYLAFYLEAEVSY